MKHKYVTPRIVSKKSFETNAPGCGKLPVPPPGSWHFSSAYDTFIGHFDSGFGGSASVSGSVGVGYGPGGTSQSYSYAGLCANWVTFSS